MSKITLFNDIGYGGEKESFENEVKNLQTLKKQVSSCKIEGGAWLLYKNPDFQGLSYFAKADVPSFFNIPVGNDSLSSFRPVPADDGNPQIVLFSDANFRGEMVVLKADDKDLSNLNFDNETSSVIVINGSWDMFDENDFTGKKWSVNAKGGPTSNGLYPNTTSFKKNVISSISKS